MIKTETAFTLLEVMVALLILSLSLSALFQNLSLSKRIALTSSINFDAVRIANNLFMDEKLMVSLKRNQEAEGDIGESGWKYKFAIEPLFINMDEEADNAVEVPGMSKVELILSHDFHSVSRTFRFLKWLR